MKNNTSKKNTVAASVTASKVNENTKEEKVMTKENTTTTATAATTATKKMTKAEEAKAKKAAEAAKMEAQKAVLVSKLFQAIADNGLTPYTWDKMPNLLAIRAGKKTVAEIYVGKKTYRINVRQTILDALKVEEYTMINNYYLPACMKDLPMAKYGTLTKVVKELAKQNKEYLVAIEEPAAEKAAA